MYLSQMSRILTTAFANLRILQHSNAVKCRTVNKSRCKDVEPELLRAHTAALQQNLSECAREFHGKMHSHDFRCYMLSRVQGCCDLGGLLDKEKKRQDYALGVNLMKSQAVY